MLILLIYRSFIYHAYQCIIVNDNFLLYNFYLFYHKLNILNLTYKYKENKEERIYL